MSDVDQPTAEIKNEVSYATDSQVSVSYDSTYFSMVNPETLRIGKHTSVDLGTGKGKINNFKLTHQVDNRTMALKIDTPKLCSPDGVREVDVEEEYMTETGEKKKRPTGKKRCYLRSEFRLSDSDEHKLFWEFLMRLYYQCCKLMAQPEVKAIVDIGIRQDQVTSFEAFRDTPSFKLPFTCTKTGDDIDLSSPMSIFSKVTFDGGMKSLFTNDDKEHLIEYSPDIVKSCAFDGYPCYYFQISVNTNKIASLKIFLSSQIVTNPRQRGGSTGLGRRLDEISSQGRQEQTDKVAQMLRNIAQKTQAAREEANQQKATQTTSLQPSLNVAPQSNMASQTGLPYQPQYTQSVQVPAGFNGYPGGQSSNPMVGYPPNSANVMLQPQNQFQFSQTPVGQQNSFQPNNGQMSFNNSFIPTHNN